VIPADSKKDKGAQGIITRQTVEHVAHLARIALKTEELDKFSKQLKEILNFIDSLKQVEVKDIKPTSHILPIENVLRQDDPGKSLTPEQTMENAPQKKGNFFIVPKVVD
jgi:aspartyl-tRNA(Asn)/glutamyl-tRNA(Gln) amidotransferase subunit C